MGARKQRWTDVEEKALREGVGKHGTGKWKQILTDPEFAGRLRARSNVDLKDKWRNMAVGGLTRKIMKNGEAAYAETSPGGKLDEKMSRGGKLYDEMSQGGKLDEEMSRGGKLYEEKHTLDALRALQGDRNGKQTNAILDHFMSKQKLLPHFKRFKKLSSMGIIHKLPTLSAAKPSHVQAELRKMNDTSIIGVWKTVQAKAMSALVRDNVQEAEFADDSTSFVEAHSSLVHPSDGTVVVCS